MLEPTDGEPLAAGEEFYESGSLGCGEFRDIPDEEMICLTLLVIPIVWYDVLHQLFFVLEVAVFALNSTDH